MEVPQREGHPQEPEEVGEREECLPEQGEEGGREGYHQEIEEEVGREVSPDLHLGLGHEEGSGELV